MTAGRPPLLLPGIVLLAALAASAQAMAASNIYKWKDADGKVHFTDTPPPPGATALDTSRETRPAAGATPTRAELARQIGKDCSPKLDAKTCAEWSDAIARDFLELDKESSSPQAQEARLHQRRSVCETMRPMLERARRQQRGEEPAGTPEDQTELSGTIARLERDVAEYCD